MYGITSHCLFVRASIAVDFLNLSIRAGNVRLARRWLRHANRLDYAARYVKRREERRDRLARMECEQRAELLVGV